LEIPINHKVFFHHYKGDILLSDAYVIINVVDGKGLMKVGHAKRIWQRYPEVFSAYREKCTNILEGFGGLGDVQLCMADGRIIANCFAHDGGGTIKKYTNLEAFKKCLHYVRNAFPEHKIAMPYNIGSEYDGTKRVVIQNIIEEIFEGYPGTLEVWELW
jgi:hypothetical protein